MRDEQGHQVRAPDHGEQGAQEYPDRERDRLVDRITRGPRARGQPALDGLHVLRAQAVGVALPELAGQFFLAAQLLPGLVRQDAAGPQLLRQQFPQALPFWSTTEEPLPIHKGDFSKPLKEAGLVLVGTKKSGHVQIVNQKPYHDKPDYNAKYTNFAYSSIFSQDGRQIYGSFNCDNALAFSPDGINFRQRWNHDNLYVADNFAASKYRMYDKVTDEKTFGVANDLGTVISYVLVKDDFMVNVHEVKPARTGLVFREGGYPLGFDEGEAVLSSGKGAEMAAKDGKITFIRNLCGYTEQFKAQGFQEDVSGSNVRYHQSVVPKLGTESSSTETFYLACMVYGMVGTESLKELSDRVTGFTQNGNTVEIQFYDGERAFLQFGEIQDVTIKLNGKTFKGPVVMARASADGRTCWVLRSDGSEACS